MASIGSGLTREYLEYLSRDFTLYPGDVISGGRRQVPLRFKRIVG